MLVNEPAEYPKSDKDNASEETLFPEKRIEKFTPLWTSSTKPDAILTSSWPSLSFEVVANEVFCRSCGYIPLVCRHGQ